MASLVLPVPVAIASSIERRSARQCAFNRFDCVLLVIAERKAKLERHLLEGCSRGILVNLKLPRETFGRRPVHQRATMVR